MRDYLSLHVDTNKNKGTACSKTRYEIKLTRGTLQHYT